MNLLMVLDGHGLHVCYCFAFVFACFADFSGVEVIFRLVVIWILSAMRSFVMLRYNAQRGIFLFGSWRDNCYLARVCFAVSFQDFG
ncbi:MAG: hypothetical protein ACPHL6_13425 [Rubripirellula sp.]